MATIILLCFGIYTGLLFLIMWLTSRKGAGNDAFFRGNRKSPWYVVAYGMIGASLSGVTFMSVPGYVQGTQFTYMGIVVGYLFGYAVIALVLLPLYYKLNLTSIYTYLDQRFGQTSYKTGSFFFIISRLLGSSLRMFLVVFVLYEFVFKAWGFPFWVPAVVFIVIILLYTFRGGIKTVIWTDTLQTTFFLLATIITIVCVLKDLDLSLFDVLKRSAVQGYTKLFETDWRADNFFVKQILSGAFITIAMTGLDQDMMQKNLTCKTLKEAQKNMFTFSFSLIFVNLLFLVLGATLLYYASETGFALPAKADQIFPSVAFSVGPFTSVVFVLGLVAAGYSSADGTLTALTTSFCYDFLRFGTDTRHTEAQKVRVRKVVHIVFAMLYLLIIIAFEPFHSDSLIATVFDVAGFTYGPLLGLFCFGLFTKRKVRDNWVPIVAVLSPVICYVLKMNSEVWFGGYKFGFELLILNGIITYFGLLLLSKKEKKTDMKIKKILFPLAIFLLLSSGCSYTVRQVKGRPSQSLNGGIFYSLPKTKIRVAVTFEYTNFDMAPYVDYAEKYLGIEVDDSRAWEIADVDITAVYEADPDHYYYVEPRNSKISVQVSEKGLLKSINSPFVEITAPDENVVERVEKINLSEYLYSTANYNMHERVDTLYAPGKGSENEESMVYVRSSVKKNEEQRAEETAKKISEIQQKKMEILYGEYESSYNENALNFVYSSLEREEKRLMQLFTGVKTTFTDVFYVEPELSKVVVDDQIVELFRFSPQEGIVDSTNEDAMPIYCNLTVENNLRAVSRYAKGKSGKGYLKKVSPKTNTSTFKYRIPEVVRVSFVTPSFTKQKTVKVSQFGTILELPARNVEAVFDSHTGELQYIRNR